MFDGLSFHDSGVLILGDHHISCSISLQYMVLRSSLAILHKDDQKRFACAMIMDTGPR